MRSAIIALIAHPRANGTRDQASSSTPQRLDRVHIIWLSRSAYLGHSTCEKYLACRLRDAWAGSCGGWVGSLVWCVAWLVGWLDSAGRLLYTAGATSPPLSPAFPSAPSFCSRQSRAARCDACTYLADEPTNCSCCPRKRVAMH
jgi:hypothetical protein